MSYSGQGNDRKSIKRRLLIEYLLPTIAFSVIFIIAASIILWNRTAANIYDYYDNNITQINLGISDYITKLDGALLNLYRDKSVIGYLRAVARSVMYERHEDDQESYLPEVKDSLKTLLNINVEIHSAMLIDMTGQAQIVYKHGVLPYTIDLQSEEFDALRESYGELVVLPCTTRKNADGSETRVISVGRKLIDSGNPNSLGTFIGYAVIVFEVDGIEDLMERYCIHDDFSVYLYDESKNSICSTAGGTEAPGREIDAAELRKASLSEDGYVVQQNITSRWEIVGVIKRQTVREQAASVSMPLLLLFFGSVGIIILISFRMGGIISGMMEHMNQQADALVEMEREKKNMQMKILYSQIKPHFLYNTLETIRMMSLVEEKELVAKAIKALADIFRYSTAKEKNKVTVLDEVLHVKNYFLLQKLRLGEKVELVCDIDESLLHGDMPPFMLQPIVENSIKHGFRRKKSKGIITIKVNKGEDEIVFSVGDNGCGMTEEQIAAVYGTADDGTAGIGLKNINRRLELLWGGKLEIKSDLGKGTTVTFRVPQ